MYYIGDLVTFADVASLLEGNDGYMKDRIARKGKSSLFSTTFEGLGRKVPFSEGVVLCLVVRDLPNCIVFFHSQ